MFAYIVRKLVGTIPTLFGVTYTYLFYLTSSAAIPRR